VLADPSVARGDGDAPIAVEEGPAIRELALPAPRAIARTTTPNATVADSSHVDEIAVLERVGLDLHGGIYTAVELGFGNLASFDDTRAPDLAIDGLASIGLRIPFGPLSAAAELDGGGRALTYTGSDAVQGEWVAEVRARGDLRLSRELSLGAVIGTSLIAHEWMAGVLIGFHGRRSR
jgi:hypothetical protein